MLEAVLVLVYLKSVVIVLHFRANSLLMNRNLGRKEYTYNLNEKRKRLLILMSRSFLQGHARLLIHNVENEEAVLE